MGTIHNAESFSKLAPDQQKAILDKVLPGRAVQSASLEQALFDAGAGFRVELRPLIAVLAEDQAVEVPGHYAPVRLDNDTPLGVVGSGYRVSQTLAQLAPLAVLMERGDVSLNRVQVTGDGARIRCSALLGFGVVGNLPDGTPDAILHSAVFEASHDGKSSTWGALQSLRLVCANGMTSWSSVAKYRVRHTTNGEARVAEAARLMLGLEAEAEREIRLFQRLRAHSMDQRTFRAFAEELLEGALGNAGDEKAREKRDAEVRELVELFQHGRGNSGATLWDGYNSVTEWIDHRRYANGKVRNSFDSSRFGAGNAVKGAALERLRRLA